MKTPDLSDLAAPDTRFSVRVTPRASRNAVTRDADGIRVTVTTVPEGGKANAAVIKLVSKTLRVPKSRIELIRGETARAKTFRISD